MADARFSRPNGAKKRRELVQYLDENRDEFYIGSFAEVMEYIQKNL